MSNATPPASRSAHTRRPTTPLAPTTRTSVLILQREAQRVLHAVVVAGGGRERVTVAQGGALVRRVVIARALALQRIARIERAVRDVHGREILKAVGRLDRALRSAPELLADIRGDARRRARHRRRSGRLAGSGLEPAAATEPKYVARAR